jgi:VWFA-related protein
MRYLKGSPFRMFVCAGVFVVVLFFAAKIGAQSESGTAASNASSATPAIPANQNAASQSSSSPSTSTQNQNSAGQNTQAAQACATGASVPPAGQSKDNEPEVSTRDSSAEVTAHDSNAAFRVPVNLVLVRVVVRDEKGKIVGNLKKEDFRLFDNRKPQTISHFSTETPTSRPVGVQPEQKAASATAEEMVGAPAAVPITRPSNFVALLFDDSDLTWPDLMRARKSAENYVTKAMQPMDRVALYTVSGQDQVDFTDDKEKIQKAMSGLQQRRTSPLSPDGSGECPNINYYEADQIMNQNNSEALYVATQDALNCAFQNDSKYLAQAQVLATAEAPRILQAGDEQATAATRRLDEVVRRVAEMPGTRSIILVSPGFLNPDNKEDVWRVIDRANRSNILINTLDARGLYAPDLGDISEQSNGSAVVAGPRLEYALAQQRESSYVLEDLADGTGAGYFHNNNDLDAGFKLLMQAPESSYLLGFSPGDLKPDGKFHVLKVTIPGTTKYNIQARRGYFAAKKNANPEEIAKQEIEEAVFSQEEIHDLPVELHTQFYKTDQLNAKLAVMTHLDVGRMQFKKEDGRNKDSLTIVAALFDRNGNYISGQQKVLDMRLKDTTLERLGNKGITVKSDFDVKPGQYVVRLVARDSTAALLTAENGMVEIPY